MSTSSSALAGTTLASTSSLTNLSSTWTSLIDDTLASEKKVRLTRLTQESSDLDTKSAIYTDLGSEITSLKNTLGALWSSNDAYIGNNARSVSVSDKTTTTVSSTGGSSTVSASSSTILTASADTTAALGTYNISVTSLAKAERISSTTVFTSSTKALGANYAGTFEMTVAGSAMDINVTADDTLYTLASKINATNTTTSGSGVSATVVDNKLILQSASTGTGYVMNMKDVSGSALSSLGILSGGSVASILTTASNAQFSVNGISVTRNTNSGIKDVINGVSLNLASDSEGSNATLTVQSDASAVKSALSTFISQYNALEKYLAAKTGLTQVSDTEYNEGDLTSDSNVRSLKSGLVDQILVNASGSSIGSIKNFSDMGVTMTDGQLSISDSDALETAAKDKSTDLKTFLDTKMNGLNNLLKTYVGDTYSYIDYSLSSIKARKTDVTNQISAENVRLTARQKELISYYENIQVTLNSLSNDSTSMTAWLKAVYSTSSST